MMQLLLPGALVAALAVALPIALHLWSRKPSRSVLFGALRWVPPDAERQAARVELTEPWLLAVRCLLLVLLALLLAKPVLNVFTNPDKIQPGWVLVAPSVLQQPNAGLLRILEDLRQEGHQVRALQKGFAQIDIAAKNVIADKREADNYWQLVQEALTKLPPDAPLWVYADAAAMHYGGARPALPARVNWQTLPVTDRQFFMAGAVSRADSVCMLLGFTDSSRVLYEKRTLAKSTLLDGVTFAGWGLIKLTAAQGQYSLVQQRESDTDTLRITASKPKHVLLVYAQTRKQDTYYCRAALGAAAHFLEAAVIVNETSTTAAVPNSKTDVLIWLAEGQLPVAVQQWVGAGGSVIRDAEQTVPSTRNSFTYGGEVFSATVLDTVKWGACVLGDGQAVVSMDTLGKGKVMKWHTRLTPVYNSLVASPQFAAWWVDQFSAWIGDSHKPRYDLRAVPAALAGPVAVAGRDEPAAATATTTELVLWFMVLGIFLLERTMSRRKGEVRD